MLTDLDRQKETLEACHKGIGETLQSQSMGGHFGRDKTGRLLAARWWFNKLYEKVSAVVVTVTIELNRTFLRGMTKYENALSAVRMAPNFL